MMTPKKMLRVAVLAACTTAVSAGTMVAQGPPPGGGGGRGGGGMSVQQMDMMAKQLDLTPDQIAKMKVIQADGQKEMMALREDTSIAQADKRPKMMAMRQAQQTKIKAILTEGQKVKYDAMMEKMREQRQEGGGPNGPPATPTPPTPPPAV